MIFDYRNMNFRAGINLLLALLFFCSCYSFGQETKVISGKSEFKHVKAGKTQAVKKVKEIPDLIIKDEVFEDPNGSNMIDGNEHSVIRFKIENIGSGSTQNVNVLVTLKNKMTKGLEFSSNIIVGFIMPGETVNVIIPIEGKMDLEQGLAEFKIHVIEEQGFDAYPLEMKIETHPYEPPRVIVAEAVFSTENGGKLKLNSPLQMKFMVQNIGKGTAEDVRVICHLPNTDCVLTGETDKFTVGKLAKGESRELEFLFVATRRYTLKEISIRIAVTENFKQYGQDTIVSVRLEQELKPQNQVIVAAIPTLDQKVQKVYLTSAVDKNIPVNPNKDVRRFALVIGNEEYSKYQPGLESESNVLFARNDATVFRDYAIKTLGIPDENVYLLIDATSGELNQKIELVSKRALKTGSEAELIFYYAGHGLPDNNTHAPLLIPVDVNATNLNSAIKLSDVYSKFGNTGCAKIVIILDACFTGAGRELALMAARSIRVKPSVENLTGNMVVISATTGDQTALPYRSEKHGLFTYFLLKRLQETKGDITYSTLANYLIKTVSNESLKINQKEQDPEINVSDQVKDIWDHWRVIK